MASDNKYTDGKIYKIISNCIPKIYVGSTTKNLSYRLKKHIYRYKEWLKKNKTGKKFSSFCLLEQPHYEIVLLELFPCANKLELLARERYWIENSNCININIPGRTKQEYNILKIICECGKTITKSHYASHLKTRQHKSYENCQKDKDKQNTRIPYSKKEWSKIIVKCDCGVEVTKAHYARHLNTENHKNPDKYRNTYIKKDRQKTQIPYSKKEWSKIIVKCDCGVEVTKAHYARHLKSRIHSLVK